MSLLDGVTVLDVGFMVAGPGAARILADLGATVIKVESPSGDVGRRLAPVGPVSVMFENYNRGKRSIAIDLRTEDGRTVFGDLVGVADMIVTNLRPAFLAEAGITWEAVHRRNPRATLAYVTSFGIDDPESGAAGGDVVAQAESGLTSYMGEPGGTPLLAQNAPADPAGAMYAVIAMLACYIETKRTGVGRLIDLSLTDAYSTLDVAIGPMVLASNGAFQTELTGRFHPTFTPHGVFRGRGGFVVISGYGSGANSMWPRVAGAIGRPDLADAPGYRSDEERRERRDEITELIESWLAGFGSTDAAVSELRSHGVIAATIRTPHEMLTSERARRRKLVRRVDHPLAGPLDVMGFPVRIEGFEPDVGPAPALGADTESVLRDLLGYEPERIAALRGSGAIVTGEDT